MARSRSELLPEVPCWAPLTLYRSKAWWISAVSSTWMPWAEASMPWVVPLLRAIQSGNTPWALSPWTMNRASSVVDRPCLPLISPTSVSKPAQPGT